MSPRILLGFDVSLLLTGKERAENNIGGRPILEDSRYVVEMHLDS
jgi:hypothetical protein